MREFDADFLTQVIDRCPDAFADLVRVGKFSSRQIARLRGQHGKPSVDNLILIADQCGVGDLNRFARPRVSVLDSIQADPTPDHDAHQAGRA